MAGDDGLPPGWEMSTDPNTGRQFYINHNTMQTSWTPPVESPLPEGWEQQRDAEGRIFFVNHTTQVTQWEDPRLAGPSVGRSGGGGAVSYPSLGGSGSGSGNGGAPSGGNGEWNCPACTFANPAHETVCVMCTQPRDGGASDPANTMAASPSTSAAYHDDSMDAATAAAIAAAQAEDEMYVQSMSNGEAVVTDPWDLAPHMVPDEHSQICTLCAKSFDFRNRRHHCKCCGSLLCNDCSARKARFSIPGMKEMDRRVCDLCFDHQSAGDSHCYLRYIGILRDAGVKRTDDRMLALRGIADMIDRLPDAMQDTASVEQQASAMRTMDVVQRCGGAATLCELLDANAPSDVQIQSCRIIASVAAVAANSPAGSEAALSRSSVCTQLSSGSMAMSAIEVMLSRQNAPWEAHMHLAHALYLVGDQPEIQDAVRENRLLPHLCEFLLASQEALQSWATMAVARLVEGSSANVRAMLDANGMQALVLLLSASNLTVQEHAAAAICSGLELEEKRAFEGAELASRVRDAMVHSGGATAAVALLRSESPTIARSGLKLLQYLSFGHAEVVRAAGAVPLVVGQLASRDTESQSSAASMLRNVTLCSPSGSADVLENGGLSMAVPLLGAEDMATRGNAAALCEAFAADEKGAGIIMESGGVSALIGLVRYPDPAVRAPAAGALVNLMQASQHGKQAVVNSGGVEALLALEGSQDPGVLRQLVGAFYSFVSDEALLESLTRRIAPPTMAMKLLQMLNTQAGILNDDHTVEMLLLVVAVLCGARDGDQYKGDRLEEDEASQTPEERTRASQEQQTRDLVASNGSPMIVPLLSAANERPALVLAAFRLMLSVCKSKNGALGLAKAGAIPAVVRALDDSLHVEGHTDGASELVAHLRLYGLSLFGRLCGGASGGGTLSNAKKDDISYGVRAIAHVLDQPSAGDTGARDNKVAIQLAAVRALRNLSCHSANWEAIASGALPQLIEMLLADDSEPALLTDIARIISNLAKLEKHCDMVLDAGAVFALLGLLSEKETEAVEAGLSTLCALAESSQRCRLAIVDQGAPAKLLHSAEQRPAPLPGLALRCLLLLSQEPANGTKITQESGATDALLRLLKSPDAALGEDALKVLLAVAKDSETLWEQLVVNADIDSSVALLKLGPPRVQGQAVSTIAALCGDSPGFALCASPTILEVLPEIVALLTPPEHLGADKSESPAKEAAAACALLSAAPAAREALLEADVVPSLVALLQRERRLGRPRSATSEHTLSALFAFSDGRAQREDESEAADADDALWARVQQLGKRRDTIDAVITILDAHIRDASPTPSGRDRFELCESAVVLLGRLPAALGPNEVKLLGRSARSINLVMNETAPESTVKACLTALGAMAKQKELTGMLTAAGTIRSVSQLLEPLTQDAADLAVPLDAGVILQAAGLIAQLVKESKDRSVDDAIIGTKAIPALAALITRTKALFPAEEHAEKALSAGLESISALALGGIPVQKAIMASGNNVLPALAEVLSIFNERGPGASGEHLARATHALLTLSRLAALDEHRAAISDSDPSILDMCEVILENALGTEEPEAAQVRLVEATVQLLSDLGPTCHRDMLAPLVQVLEGEAYAGARGACLATLSTLLVDPGFAEPALALCESLLPVLGAVMADEDAPSGDRGLASAILARLAALDASHPAEVADKALDICSAALLHKDAATPARAVMVSHALLALQSLLLAPETREKVRGSAPLLRALRTIGTSAQGEYFASFLVSRIFAALGTGDRITKQAAAPAPAPAPHPPAPPPAFKPPQAGGAKAGGSSTGPPPAASLVRKNSAGSTSTASSGSHLPSVSPLLASASRPPPPPMPQGSLLPTYSNSVGSSGLRPAARGSLAGAGGSADADRASLELARRLQAEENARASTASKNKSPVPHKPAPPSKWKCDTCTFENGASAAKCEMCGAARPPTARPPSYGAGNGTVTVCCPRCQTMLAAPQGAQVFQCMSCMATSPVPRNSS